MDKKELTKISQMRDLNHQKLLQIEEQISKLDQVIQEHETVYRSLLNLSKTKDGTEGMIPIGAGIQIPLKYMEIDSMIVDLGSGLHAERSLGNTIELLDSRVKELKKLIEQLVGEHEITTETIKNFDVKINSTIIKNEKIEKETPNKNKTTKRNKRRRYGGELTLDD